METTAYAAKREAISSVYRRPIWGEGRLGGERAGNGYCNSPGMKSEPGSDGKRKNTKKKKDDFKKKIKYSICRMKRVYGLVSRGRESK